MNMSKRAREHRTLIAILLNTQPADWLGAIALVLLLVGSAFLTHGFAVDPVFHENSEQAEGATS